MKWVSFLLLIGVFSTHAAEWQIQQYPIIKKGGRKSVFHVTQPAVLKTKGKYWMWYAGYWGKQDILLSTTPNGKKWTSYDNEMPVLPRKEESQLVSSPCIIKDGDTFKMWYTFSNTWKTGWKVGYAESTDGKAWEPIKMKSILNPPEGYASINDVSVLKKGDQYYMWYSVKKKDNWKVEIFLAKSANGIQWQAKGKVSFDASYPGLIIFPWVVQKDEKFVMFFNDIHGKNRNIVSAVSEDGMHWKSKFLPAIKNAGTPTALFDQQSKTWKLWFTRNKNIYYAELKK